jgi:hypothetical protein
VSFDAADPLHSPDAKWHLGFLEIAPTIHESSTRYDFFLSLYIFSFCGWLPFFDAYTKSISSPGMIGLGSFHTTELSKEFGGEKS